jgi:hypothetical protein
MIPGTLFLKETSRNLHRAALVGLSVLSGSPALLASTPFAAPSAGESLSPGSVVELRWTSPCDDLRRRNLDEAELVLSLDGGRTFPVRVTPELNSCATRFVWTVPALPAAHARLALRAGAEERDASEALVAVSADFRILPDPDGRVEQLRRRAAEWWTPSRPPAATAEDLLERTFAPARPRVSTPFALPEAFAPPTGPSAARLEPAANLIASSTPRVLAAVDRPFAARSAGAPTPLRL